MVHLLLMLSLVACSEYGLEGDPKGHDLALLDGDSETDGELTRPDDEDGPGNGTGDLDDPDDDGEGTDEIDTYGDPDQPPTGSLPEEHPTSDCDPNLIADFSSSEIWIGAQGNTTASGTIEAPLAGWYHLYNTHIVESGGSQHNESAFFRIPNVTNPDGYPLHGNCGPDRVVVDADNDGPPPGNQTLIGTFWLDEGSNELVMTHYCTLYEQGLCPQHHITDPANQTCESNNINSVHFMGFGVCLVPAVP